MLDLVKGIRFSSDIICLKDIRLRGHAWSVFGDCVQSYNSKMSLTVRCIHFLSAFMVLLGTVLPIGYLCSFSTNLYKLCDEIDVFDISVLQYVCVL